MTQTFDKLMVKAGFDAGDVAQVKSRNWLYSGILVMMGLSGFFLALLVL